jgi:hypothetical protein
MHACKLSSSVSAQARHALYLPCNMTTRKTASIVYSEFQIYIYIYVCVYTYIYMICRGYGCICTHILYAAINQRSFFPLTNSTRFPAMCFLIPNYDDAKHYYQVMIREDIKY